jgi:hypothetical protein
MFLLILLILKLTSSLSEVVQFVVIGDWGGAVLDKNSDYIHANHYDMLKTGTAVQVEKIFMDHKNAPKVDDFFVVTTGDNFYSNGVKNVNDPLWVSDYLIPFEKVTCDWYPVLGEFY